jgi:hypothetical protein
MKSLFSDEDVWSAALSIGLKGLHILIRRLDPTKIFPKTVFLGVAMELQLDDEDVWSVELEYRLKRATTFDPTVGSRSNFSTSCFLWGSYGMATG